MHDHGQILELAAAAIDFELDPVERAQLDAALEACPLCRRQASAMRATATIMGRSPDIGTPSRVRDVVMGAALRSGNRSPRWRPMLLASLSLVAVLGGAAVFVESRGSNVGQPASPPAPSPLETAVALASPTPSSSPVPTVLPSPFPTATTAPEVLPTQDSNRPLQAGDIAAMVTDGRLVIRTKPGQGTDSAVYKTMIYPGQRVLILDGPVEASGYPWFRVRLGTIEGWVAAASKTAEPWLAPVRNGLIAFVRDEPGGSGEAIYTVDPRVPNSETRLLSDPSLGHYAQLTWSPNGRRLALVATITGASQGLSDIFVVDADGSNLVQVTHNDVDDDSPAWSPDSQQIAFRQTDPTAVTPDGLNLLVVARPDGSALRVLGTGANAVWSPDGRELAMTGPATGTGQTWVQAADGTNRRLVAGDSVAYGRPAWSPDGQSLILSSGGLFLVQVATGAITLVTAEPGVMPTWSPGGDVAFTTNGSASVGIFVVNPDGTGLRRVWGAPGVGALPFWSPDGRQLLLANDMHGSAIAIVDPTSSTLTSIAGEGSSGSPAWQPRLP